MTSGMSKFNFSKDKYVMLLWESISCRYVSAEKVEQPDLVVGLHPALHSDEVFEFWEPTLEMLLDKNIVTAFTFHNEAEFRLSVDRLDGLFARYSVKGRNPFASRHVKQTGHDPDLTGAANQFMVVFKVGIRNMLLMLLSLLLHLLLMLLVLLLLHQLLLLLLLLLLQVEMELLLHQLLLLLQVLLLLHLLLLLQDVSAAVDVSAAIAVTGVIVATSAAIVATGVIVTLSAAVIVTAVIVATVPLLLLILLVNDSYCTGTDCGSKDPDPDRGPRGQQRRRRRRRRRGQRGCGVRAHPQGERGAVGVFIYQQLVTHNVRQTALD